MEQTIKWVGIETLQVNPDNPRVIKDDKFKKLVKSIREYPRMLELRPIIVDDNNIIIGGNMRYIACKNLGMKEVPVLKADAMTEEQKAHFIVADNVSYGEWDWDILANNYEQSELVEWGVEVMNWSADYVPEYNPVFDTRDITQEQVEKRAQEIAKDIVKTMTFKSVMCPECSHEFDVA